MKNLNKIAVKVAIASILAFLFFSAPAFAAASNSDCNNSSDAGIQNCVKNNQIVKDLNFIVNFLSAGVGIVVIGTIIVGGVQYTLAGDNSQLTGAAKQRIINGLIALAVFIFSFAFLQWIIPGGL